MSASSEWNFTVDAKNQSIHYRFQKALMSHLNYVNPARVWRGGPGPGEVVEDEQTEVTDQQEYAL